MAEAGAAEGAGQALARLLALLEPGRPVAVQTHDFPDLDALASGWALSRLLAARGYATRLCARGESRSRSLRRLVNELGIVLADDCEVEADSQVLVVDGSPGNGNVSLVGGRLLGVIDHHLGPPQPPLPFVDLNPGLAACSTRLAAYWQASGLAIPRPVATALLAGIQSDTDYLSARAGFEDLEAYGRLFRQGDPELAASIVKTSLDLAELRMLARAISGARVSGDCLLALVPRGRARELLAVLADFALRAEDLGVAIVIEDPESAPEAGEGRAPSVGCDDLPEQRGIHLSVRSRRREVSAFALVRSALEGLGSGGGHAHAAGGYIPLENIPPPAELRERFFSRIPPT